MNLKSSAPLVSIALCTYNGSKYLREQLESLLAQTYAWHELIVVDDCSTDDTLIILREYAEKEPRIIIYQNTANIGLDKNFFKAMALCSGDLIAPCDQDDIWLPQKLDDLVNFIGDRSLIYCDSEFISSTGELLYTQMSDRLSMISTTDPSCFVFQNCVSGHALLMRREVLHVSRGTPDSFSYDWWLAAVAASMKGVTYLDRVLVWHRQHSSNTTNTFSTQSKQRRARGHRLNAMHNVARRIETLSQIRGNHRPFLSKLLYLWRARESQWFCGRLAAMMFLHGARLYAPRRSISFFFLASLAQRSFWGIRIKRLTNRYAYRT